MTKEGELYAKFLERAEVQPSGEIFLTGGAAQQFVMVCQSAGMAVLGIEGVRIDSNGVAPYLDVIADYSPRTLVPWEAYQERCNRFAHDFLRNAIDEKGVGIYFCFEVLGPDEYVECLRKLTSGT